jgi:aminopeptidase
MLEKYARLIVGYCTEVQPGDNVSLNVETPALPLARALTREVLRAGANPLLRLTYPEFVSDILELGSDAQFDGEPTFDLNEIRQVDAWIRVSAPDNSRELQNADKTLLARRMKRNRPVQNVRLNETRWLGTIFPTPAGAQDAGMSNDEFREFAYRAMFLYEDDPASAWQAQFDRQVSLVERLSRADEVHIKGPGTDLKLSVKGRKWENSAGKRNMPCGEVFTGPVESSAEGVITYDIPSAVNGVEVRNIRLRFEQGKVVEAHAEKGDDLLQAQLAADPGARYLGELGIGTNYQIQRPSMSILYDEKIGGTVHLALGQSYASTGGVNESAIHWDMITDLRGGGAIYLDGELFQEDGQFKL